MAPGLLHPVHPGQLQFHREWLQHWGHGSRQWNWHRILRTFDPFHWIFTPILGAAVLAVRRLLQRAREGRAATWPVTDATVLAVHLKAHDGYRVEVEYRYFARDEYRYGKFRRHFRRKAAATDFSEAVRSLRVPVHFRDDDPNVSVLIEADVRLVGQQTGSLKPL